MLDAKLVADAITITRAFLGVLMIWLGLMHNGEALPIVIPLMVLCWTGDFVDGGLARRSRHPRRTWIGDRDVHFDLFVSLCLGIYMIGAGYVDLKIGLGYLFVWVLLFLLWGMNRNLLMLMQAPIYLTFIITAIQVAPGEGYLLVAWVLVATAINWRRFTRDVVPKFIAGMKSLWNGHGRPGHS